jgi:hypothetical protein
MHHVLSGRIVKLGLIVAMVLALSMVTGSEVQADGLESSVIHSCVNSNGNIRIIVSGPLECPSKRTLRHWNITTLKSQIVLSPTLAADGNSHQAVEADAILTAAFGTSVALDTAHGAAVMGNLISGENLTKTNNYLAGVIGKYNLTGTVASTYPKGGVLGIIASETTISDGAVVAVLDGDSGLTTGNAAYKVIYLNSTPGSMFDYGLDLFGDADGAGAYAPVSFGTADIRLQNGETISNATNGIIALGGNATVSGTLGVTGTTTLAGLNATSIGATTKGTGAFTTLSSTGDASVGGDLSVTTGRIILDSPGPTFSGIGSRQAVQADATFDAYTGSSYGAGVMGHAKGTINALSVSTIAGLIGKYNVGTNVTAYPAAGVVGEDSAGTADAGILAVLGGDSGVVTAGAAYGVRYLNSTAASKFAYGLDLSGAAIGSYQPVSYATADIRLQNEETISNATNGIIALGGNATVSGTLGVTGTTTLAGLNATSIGATTKGTGAFTTLSSTGDASVGGDLSVTTGRIILDSPGPTFSGIGSRQAVQADATFDAYTGSSYGAGVMGHAKGTINALSVSTIAGLIGKYNVGTNVTAYPAAGVVGEDSAGTADAGILAVLGGDSGVVTAGAAYGVRYLNSTAASKFAYGLDLSGAAIGSYQPVSYATADIRLQNEETISNATNGIIALGGGDVFVGTLGSGVILRATDIGTVCRRLTVTAAGVLGSTEVTCP